MKPNWDEILLIGVDGGATETKVHEVVVSGSGAKLKFHLGPHSASRKYRQLPDFKPVDVLQQIKERNEGTTRLTPEEERQGREYIVSTAEAVQEIVKATGRAKVLIGMGMPGLKTEDGRGINAINNGARTPGFLDLLEKELNEMGIELAAPVARLGSDADYCGIGEQYAAEGLFRKVQNAYYFGGGTGIADAMKLDGELVPFDKTKDWMQKSWQIACSLGPTYEKLIAAKAMNETFARMEKSTLDAYVTAGKFAQVEAVKGNPRAKFVMETIATLLAELVFERMYTLYAGRENTPWRGAGYMALNPDHPYRGRFFDTIVLGQRIGAIYADPEYRRILRAPLHARMEDLLKNFGSPEMQQVYLKDGKLRAGLFAASKLRQAPAIGAAVDAVRCLAESK
jgi:hypothetical protein